MSELLRVRADALEWLQVEGQVIALDLRHSVYLSVNPSGAILWPSLVEGASREQLVERLSSECGIEREAAERDVDAFVIQMGELDLLLA